MEGYRSGLSRSKVHRVLMGIHAGRNSHQAGAQFMEKVHGKDLVC
jgi:hypothetical protein